MECTHACAHTWRPDTDVMCFPQMIKNKNLIFWDRVSHSTWSSLVRQDWLSRFLLSLPTHTLTPYLIIWDYKCGSCPAFTLVLGILLLFSDFCNKHFNFSAILINPIFPIKIFKNWSLMALYIVHVILLLVGTCIDGIHMTIKFWGGRNLSLMQLCIIWA